VDKGLYVSPDQTEVKTSASDKRPPTSSNNAAKIINMTVKKDK
jgi:hypothetical protein